jgi:hypothetical protein
MKVRKYSAQEIIDLIDILKSRGNLPPAEVAGMDFLGHLLVRLETMSDAGIAEDVTAAQISVTQHDISKPDIVEVSRKAHEISSVHGQNGWNHAEKLAAAALASGQVREHQFWETVAAALRPPPAGPKRNE